MEICHFPDWKASQEIHYSKGSYLRLRNFFKLRLHMNRTKALSVMPRQVGGRQVVRYVGRQVGRYVYQDYLRTAVTDQDLGTQNTENTIDQSTRMRKSFVIKSFFFLMLLLFCNNGWRSKDGNVTTLSSAANPIRKISD